MLRLVVRGWQGLLFDTLSLCLVPYSSGESFNHRSVAPGVGLSFNAAAALRRLPPELSVFTGGLQTSVASTLGSQTLKDAKKLSNLEQTVHIVYIYENTLKL